MKRLVVIAVCIVAAGLLWGQFDPEHDLNADTDGGFAQPAYWVEVVNWPDTQTVAGTVNVGNLPDVQDVAGSVSVDNLPELQQVSGTVAIGNLPREFELVGFTVQTLDGGNGVFGFLQACQAEFPGSRMCTSEEVIRTTNVPAYSGSADFAWMQPLFVGYARYTHNHSALDVSGYVADPFELTCAYWQASNDSRRGLAVRLSATDGYSYGGVSARPCSEESAIACCARAHGGAS